MKDLEQPSVKPFLRNVPGVNVHHFRFEPLFQPEVLPCITDEVDIAGVRESFDDFDPLALPGCGVTELGY